MNDRRSNEWVLPPEQQSLRERCFHPTGTFSEFPFEDVATSIPARFEKIVHLYSARLAVSSRDERLTYAELNRFANRTARAILTDGDTGMAVGIFLPHGLWPIAAHLGVLKAGKMSVLADPAQPADRNQRILEESQAGVVITNNKHLVIARQLANPAARMINLDDLDPFIGDQNLGLALDANSYAYLHYSSGSSGTSRGAIKRHGNVLHSVMNLTNDYRVCAEDRILLNVRNTLGKHVFEALLNGAALLTYDVREDGLTPLAPRLREQQITMSKFFPSTFRSWLATLSPDDRFPSMRLIRLGGETVYGSDVERYRRFFTPDCLLINSYGSSETGSVSNYFVDRDIGGSAAVPAGFPIPGKEVSIVDEKGNELPPGEIGEIVVKSNFLSKGYWRRPDLTIEKFRDANGGKMKLCHTGDLGRISEDGCLHHLGRIDSQIKVRGFRVDLGEIESLLSAHPGLAGAAVIARPNGADDVRLIAYVVPRSAQTPSVGMLRRYLGERLPEYMIPSFYQRVAGLPLTNTGKIDRRALPDPGNIRPDLDNPYAEPVTATEQRLAAIWREVLSLDRVGIHDNFLHLGGHSLAASRIIARVRKTFDVDLPVRTLFDAPTIADLANIVEQHELQHESVSSDKFTGKCIHQFFEEQVEKTPDAIAILFEEQKFTYRELNNQANQLARHLRSLGVGSEALVGICLERSPEMIVGLLGILKAGGAYVPLDPAYPSERLRFMVDDAQVSVLLTQRAFVEAGKFQIVNSDSQPGQQSVSRSAPKLVCPDSDRRLIAKESATNPDYEAYPEQLAYVIYTSGSTGTPKGTLVEHRNVVRLFQATEGLFDFDAHDTWTLFHSCAFDFSVWEIWGALLHGAQLLVVPWEITRSPHEFAEVLTNHRVTVLNQTPAAFRQLIPELIVKNYSERSALRYVIFGGEALDPRSLSAWFERFGENSPRLINMYGITETTVHVTYRQITKADATAEIGSVIGKPLPDLRIYLLDENRTLVPPGVAGEIYVGGAGIARGYLNRPELTAERFIDRSFDEEPPQRLYKSGDLARYLPDGDLEFLGRADDQVKIRGYRIELGEIEATLAQHPAVRNCAVIAYEQQVDVADNPKSKIRNQKSDKRLTAYVVTDDGRLPSTELRDFLAHKLPDYMIPWPFISVQALPLTTNGKLDRKALTAPDQKRDGVDNDFAAPRTQTEEVLARIFAEALKIDRIGIHDNFFEWGGHSLLATQVVARIRSTFNTDLALRTLFETPTIAALANTFQPGSAAAQTLLPLPPSQGIPLSFAQERLWFLDQFNPHSATYNMSAALRLTGDLDIPALEQSFNELIRRHQSLRTIFPAISGRPFQEILPSMALMLSWTSLEDKPAAERDAVLATQLQEEARRPFDLARGPLIRAHLWRCGAFDHVLLLTLHHIVCDGWSMSVLWRELSALYRGYRAGEPACLPELPIQYTDYAVWQRGWLQGETLKKQVSYWKTKLAGLTPLHLPTDHPRPIVQTDRGGSVNVRLPVQLCSAIKSFSQRENTTLFMTLLAAFQALLCRYTGQTDITVGTPIAGRTRQETDGLIGFFVNTLVLRADLSDNPAFRELLDQVRDMTLDAYTHQDLPFEKLVQELQPERNTGISPLFQVMFIFQDPDSFSPKLEGLAAERIRPSTHSAKFDLSLSIRQQEGSARAAITYNADLFERATIERMLRYFQILLKEIIDDPGMHIADLALPSEKTKSRHDTTR